jgi:hypothetical protein
MTQKKLIQIELVLKKFNFTIGLTKDIITSNC